MNQDGHDPHHGHEITRVMRPMYARKWLLGPAPRHAVPECCGIGGRGALMGASSCKGRHAA